MGDEDVNLLAQHGGIEIIKAVLQNNSADLK